MRQFQGINQDCNVAVFKERNPSQPPFTKGGAFQVPTLQRRWFFKFPFKNGWLFKSPFRKGDLRADHGLKSPFRKGDLGGFAVDS
jgi:hypothetical protein